MLLVICVGQLLRTILARHNVKMYLCAEVDSVNFVTHKVCCGMIEGNEACNDGCCAQSVDTPVSTARVFWLNTPLRTVLMLFISDCLTQYGFHRKRALAIICHFEVVCHQNDGGIPGLIDFLQCFHHKVTIMCVECTGWFICK